MPEPPVGAGAVGRAARWRAGNKPLLEKLSREQLAALQRASRGYPPFVLGHWNAPDHSTTLVDALQTIKETTRAILGGYDWPDGDLWPTGDGNSQWPAS